MPSLSYTQQKSIARLKNPQNILNVLIKTSLSIQCNFQFLWNLQRLIFAATSISQLSLLLGSLGDNWGGRALMVFTRVDDHTTTRNLWSHWHLPHYQHLSHLSQLYPKLKWCTNTGRTVYSHQQGPVFLFRLKCRIAECQGKQIGPLRLVLCLSAENKR